MMTKKKEPGAPLLRLGRKRLAITYAQVADLRRHPDRLSWDEIAAQLDCSRRTAIRVFQAGSVTSVTSVTSAAENK